MGRLNYTNVSLAGGTHIVGRRADPRLQRKIDGVKLGQVVAKDLVSIHRGNYKVYYGISSS